MAERTWFNMYQRRELPYRVIQEGDTLYWLDTTQAAIVWKSRVRAVERFQYDSKDAVRERVQEQLFRDKVGIADLDHPYFSNSEANQGYFLAFQVYAVSPIQDVPKPSGYRFPQLGWLELNSDAAPQEWRARLLRPDDVQLPDVDESASPAADLAEPSQRQQITTYRILRDTALAKRVKALQKNECQICGHTIVLPDGSRYSEGHHIQPLGRPHDGPDVMANIICVCPNHHAEMDYGVRPLSLAELRTVAGHSIGEEYIRYHNEVICGSTQE